MKKKPPRIRYARKRRPVKVHPDYVRVLNRVVDAFAPAMAPTPKAYLDAARVLIEEAKQLGREQLT